MARHGGVLYTGRHSDAGADAIRGADARAHGGHDADTNANSYADANTDADASYADACYTDTHAHARHANACNPGSDASSDGRSSHRACGTPSCCCVVTGSLPPWLIGYGAALTASLATVGRGRAVNVVVIPISSPRGNVWWF